jgi:DNA primase small subunit
MPHSITPEEDISYDQDMAIDIEATNVESEFTQAMLTVEDEVQDGGVSDQDITMADPVAERESKEQKLVKVEERSEVKLEDLFADVESDEEFPSSAPGPKLEDSPETPASPV